MKSLSIIRPARHQRRALLAASAMACALFAASVAAAFAAPAADEPVSAANATSTATPASNSNARLETLFQRKQKQVSAGSKLLDRAGDVATKAEQRIADLKSKGQDTSKLESALASFKSAIASAKSLLDQAQSTLGSHPGFDDSGKVTDPSQARSTLESVRQSLEGARQAMKKAGQDFRAALSTLKDSNRLQREEKNLGALQKALERAHSLANRIQEFITQRKASGADTSNLETALASFNSSVAAAQSGYDQAKSTLDTHAGFDANGSVTDSTQAKSTLDTAGKALRDAAQSLRVAVSDLRNSASQFRRGSASE